MPFKPKERQYRSIVGIQEYAQEDNELILRGSPIVFDRETVLFKDDQGREFLEKIDRHALDACDFSDFIFNRNHVMNDGTVYARSRNGSVTWRIGETALDVEIRLDASDRKSTRLNSSHQD